MSYKIWANIIITHEYLGGKCSDFKFLPDNATLETIKREGFLANETSGGLLLIAPESTFAEEVSLTFWAYPTRQDLWSATLFDGTPKGSIPLAKAKGATLQWESTNEEKIPKEIRTPKPMFGVEISHSGDTPEAPTTLSFKTKRLKWRYNISGLSDFGETEITGVKTNKGACQFDSFTSPSGVTIFTSKQEIPLCYGAAPRFQLREKKSSKAIIKCLPNMDTRAIASAVLEGNKEEQIAETFINT